MIQQCVLETCVCVLVSRTHPHATVANSLIMALVIYRHTEMQQRGQNRSDLQQGMQELMSDLTLMNQFPL